MRAKERCMSSADSNMNETMTGKNTEIDLRPRFFDPIGYFSWRAALMPDFTSLNTVVCNYKLAFLIQK